MVVSISQTKILGMPLSVSCHHYLSVDFISVIQKVSYAEKVTSYFTEDTDV